MKKSYLMIAAAAALFAACSSNDVFKEVEEQETAISFNPFASNETKAAITGADNAARLASLATAGGFKVYGYKTIDSWAHASTIFNGTTVTSSNSGVDWTYTGLRFWDKTATYNFYAVAPSAPSGGAAYAIEADPTDADFGMITITGATSAKYSAANDFLVDRDGAKNELGSAHTLANNPAVNIDFHHIMAKVVFALKSTLSSGTITVTSLKMKGWNSGVATFAQDKTITGAPSSLVCGEWTFTSNGSAEIALVGSGTGNTSVALTCSTSATATTLADWYIMVPQAIAANALEFTVTYTFDDGAGYTETFTDQPAKVTTAQTWGTDSHTTYTLDIKPAEIIFDVTSICDFDVDGGNQSVPVE
jgi:hypothetical protein